MQTQTRLCQEEKKSVQISPRVTSHSLIIKLHSHFFRLNLLSYWTTIKIKSESHKSLKAFIPSTVNAWHYWDFLVFLLQFLGLSSLLLLYCLVLCPKLHSTNHTKSFLLQGNSPTFRNYNLPSVLQIPHPQSNVTLLISTFPCSRESPFRRVIIYALKNKPLPWPRKQAHISELLGKENKK